MGRNFIILLIGAAVIGLPFLLKQDAIDTGWRTGDPSIIVISPHNEAIRFEFAQKFSRWHETHHGSPAKIDWRVIGGTSEIVRYLGAEYGSSFRGYWRGAGKAWPNGASEQLLNRSFDSAKRPESSPKDEWQEIIAARTLFRDTDDANEFGGGIDLFFGGGEYDHNKIYRQGLSVNPWPGEQSPPAGLFTTQGGTVLIPERLSGETWRTPTLYGSALSTFGICYNLDRLQDLGFKKQPSRWEDLIDPRFSGQLGVADPTKSGSIAKAFEMIIHQQCAIAIQAAGYDAKTIAAFEEKLSAARPAPGDVCEGVPIAYQNALEAGWLNGIRLVQRIGANARYFTDSASKVPIDVSMGNAAAGLAIDFYGRYQAETSRAPNGRERMVYVTPEGGSSVSCDPISLLRGAPNRDLAVLFMEFALGEEGQKLWNYRPGSEGGPMKFSLRRLPIRRDFYPSEAPELTGSFAQHEPHLVDNFASDRINPYALATEFTYYPRWTGRHFGVHRNLVRAMCLDAGVELRAAWESIIEWGGPDGNPEAMAALTKMPDGVTWTGVLTNPQFGRGKEMTFMRDWTLFYRAQYAQARALAESRMAAQ